MTNPNGYPLGWERIEGDDVELDDDFELDFDDDDDDEYYDDEYDYDDSMDGDFDSAMRDAGWGTDEDYGYYGDGEY